MKDLSEILEFACNKHGHQIDKAGMPYIFHIVEVSLGVDDTREKAVAFLHDVLEDTDTTADELLEFGIEPEVVEAVEILTRKKNEDYMEYIKKVATNPLSRNVKMSDLRHNMKIERIPNPTEKDYARLEKYKKAYEYLENLVE